MLSQHVHQIPTIHVLVLVPFRPHTEHQEAADATRVSQEVNLMRQPAVSHHALLALGSIAPIQSTTAWIQHRQAHWHDCRFKECWLEAIRRVFFFYFIFFLDFFLFFLLGQNVHWHDPRIGSSEWASSWISLITSNRWEFLGFWDCKG